MATDDPTPWPRKGDPRPGPEDEGRSGPMYGEPEATSESADTVRIEQGRDPLIGRKIGQYSIRKRIASGGMGSVYLATQERPRRTVAVKLMKQGVASRSALRRFEFEAQLLARLSHPGIGQIYEAGSHDDGNGAVPYFAMEYVSSGLPLVEYASRKQLATRQRLELFAKVCDAVGYGHQKGIIHRDLKPANILVDGSGEPKVIDFGVARATDSDMAVTTQQTDLRALIGTLQYMSPEQCGLDVLDLDTGSDVYSLGIVLYELLCDNLPYDLSDTPVQVAVRTICEQEPARPSTFNRTLRGNLETIALKALDKDRTRRYRNAYELGDDVRRYLNDEPIAARPPGVVEALRRFWRRRRAAALSIVGAAVVLFALCVVTYDRLVLAPPRAAASDYLARLDATVDDDVAADAFALLSGRREVPYLSRRLRGYERSAEDGYRAFMVRRADRLDELARERLASGRIDEAMMLAAAAARRGLRPLIPEVAGAYASQLYSALLVTYRVAVEAAPGRDAVRFASAAMSRDGELIALGRDDGVITIRDVGSGRELLGYRGHSNAVASVSFSRDRRSLFSIDRDGVLKHWDVRSGAEIMVLPTGSASATSSSGRAGQALRRFSVLATSPSEDLVAVASGENAWLYNAMTGSERFKLAQRGRIECMAFAPSGAAIATGSDGGAVRIWSVATGKRLHLLMNPGSVASVCFSPRDERLAVAADGLVYIWALDSVPREVMRVEARSHVRSISYSPDGQSLLTVSSNGAVRIWEVRSMQEPPRSPRLGVATVALETTALPGRDATTAFFAFGETRVVTLLADATARLWDLPSLLAEGGPRSAEHRPVDLWNEWQVKFNLSVERLEEVGPVLLWPGGPRSITGVEAVTPGAIDVVSGSS